MCSRPLPAGRLACGFVVFATCASAQFSLWNPGSSSPDTFGGDPDSNKFIRIPSDTDDWTRHFRIGAMVGFNIKASFNESGLFSTAGNNGANGIYSDGYVQPDKSGDTAFTSNWGYQNASQYNAAQQTLTMHGTSAYSLNSGSQNESGAFPGFDMAYGDNIWYWKHARVGWELGFGLLPITIKDNNSLPASVTQDSYVYSTSGLSLVPGAPYSGNGGANGTGPLLPLAYQKSTQLYTGSVSGSRELDEILYTFRLGPSFYWDLNEYFGMSFGAGPSLGLVSGTYKYNEMVTANGSSSSSSGSFGTTDVTYGGYVNGTLLFHIMDDADCYLGAQYMHLGDAAFSNGGRQADLKLGGQVYVSLGINWPF